MPTLFHACASGGGRAASGRAGPSGTATISFLSGCRQAAASSTTAAIPVPGLITSHVSVVALVSLDPDDLSDADRAALLRWRLALGPGAEKTLPAVALPGLARAAGDVGLGPDELAELDRV